MSSLAKQLKQNLVEWRKDQFRDWCQDTMRAIEDPKQQLRFDIDEKQKSIQLFVFQVLKQVAD